MNHQLINIIIIKVKRRDKASRKLRNTLITWNGTATASPSISTGEKSKRNLKNYYKRQTCIRKRNKKTLKRLKAKEMLLFLYFLLKIFLFFKN